MIAARIPKRNGRTAAPTNGRTHNAAALADQLPPHDLKIEAGALGCVLLATCSKENGQAEIDAMLMQLKPNLFYDLRHKNLLVGMHQMRMGEIAHNVDIHTLGLWFKDRLHEVGGLDYIAGLPDQTPSLWQFEGYRKELVALAQRRWMLSQAAEFSIRAREGDVDLSDLRSKLSDSLDSIDKAVRSERPMIETWTAADAAAYIPDPTTFLIGEGMICRGEFSILAGPAGAGKSRLALTLALAGARGAGSWMGYKIKRRFRTLILQSENSRNRIKSDLAGVDPALNDYVRMSLPCAMNFSDPKFRAELKKLWEGWRFDLIVIDNMNDVARQDGREDYLEGLANIMAALPREPDCPAVVIVAHLTKGSGRALKPMTGRKLLDEISGSNTLAAKARTVFTLQHADPADNTSDLVIFDCAKSNNDHPLAMAAYHRRDGEFLPEPHFDYDSWLNPTFARPSLSC